ncbi:isoaspartyl peptidase/L-asparaginase [bacterium]|nr:isoaspartyl peptidase/L-asparaginase [bacterium]
MQRPTLIVHGGAGPWPADLLTAAVAGCGEAAAAGWAILAAGGSAIDAVEAAVRFLEDDPRFNAGVGSSLTDAGTVEMDASIMDGASGRGAGVAGVTTIRNPVRLARTLLVEGRHVLVAGAGAEQLGRAHRLPAVPPESLVTAVQRRRWSDRLAGQPGTVGAVACDAAGHVAAATSTGGLRGKRAGRIGDSAVIGAGTYADDRAGAASATGDGEAILLAGLTRAAVDGVRAGRDPAAVAAALVRDLTGRAVEAGLILVDRFGRAAIAHGADAMPTAQRSPVGRA